jgi:hypothetical protein
VQPSTKLTTQSFASVLARAPPQQQATVKLAMEGGLAWVPVTASNTAVADVKGARDVREGEEEQEGWDDAVVPRGLKGRQFRRR